MIKYLYHLLSFCNILIISLQRIHVACSPVHTFQREKVWAGEQATIHGEKSLKYLISSRRKWNLDTWYIKCRNFNQTIFKIVPNFPRSSLHEEPGTNKKSFSGSYQTFQGAHFMKNPGRTKNLSQLSLSKTLWSIREIKYLMLYLIRKLIFFTGMDSKKSLEAAENLFFIAIDLQAPKFD